MSRLTGKVAVVTGASTGMGRAITKRFIDEGAMVIGVARRQEKLDELAADFPNALLTVSCDVSNATQIGKLVEVCKEKFDTIDILINNAGISGGEVGKRLHETSVEAWDTVVNVNLRSVYLMMRGFIPLMLARGGSVVNIASIGGLTVTSGNSAYYTSKAGVVQLSKAAAMDYVANSIRVNTICPGIIDTPILEGVPEGMIQALASGIPMQRLGKPEEIASLALFLASDEASYTTGAIFIADGGATAGSV